MAFEEEETGAAAWDTDARGAAFLKRFLTRMARQAALANQRELYGAWRVWLHKLREERRTRGSRARRARHDAMLATLREHAPGERDAAVVAGLVAWASGAFAGADASALPQLCQHLAVTERAAGDLLWLQGDVADKYYVLHAGLIKLFRHSTPIMTRECRELYGDRRAVLRRRPHELARAARGAADEAPARDDEPALAPRPPSPTPAPTPAPASASPHVAEAPAPASLHVAEAPAPAQGTAGAPAPAAPVPAEERPRSAAAPAEARRPRPEADPEWDTLGVATKDVLPGTGLGEGALLRSVGVTGASSADAPYVDTAACIEPCVVLEVLGGVEINQRAKGLRGRPATPSSGRHVDGVSTQ